MRTFPYLQKKSTLIIFAYAPFGFGHLRVTDALYHGLSPDITPLLLGSRDRLLNFFYRFFSVHPFARAVMETAQKGQIENISTPIYRWFLRTKTHSLYLQMITLIDEWIALPETIVIVATHFGLAHQVAAIKSKLEKDRNVRIVLIVQVTDDSPQSIWYVPGADIIIVPSVRTKLALEKYGKQMKLPHVRIDTIPYPVSPLLSRQLSQVRFEQRCAQVESKSSRKTHIVIPISGAAVGMTYFVRLMDEIHFHEKDITFSITCKSVIYTQPFLNEMLKRSYVKLYVSPYDRAVIDMYEEIYYRDVVSLEITKPSEQAFKALLEPTQKGGSILLFVTPVGRQEYDNKDFLRRHHLLPPQNIEFELWAKSNMEKDLNDSEKNTILEMAVNWRGLSLPAEPLQAARFILWLKRMGILSAMMHYKIISNAKSVTDELGGQGVNRFWALIEQVAQKS